MYLEGAAWDLEKRCVTRQPPKQLTEPLPVLKVIPVEAHRLKLQVGSRDARVKAFKMVAIILVVGAISANLNRKFGYSISTCTYCSRVFYYALMTVGP